mmetsp:Transcript_64292/g.103972  ORF Transcript_64292/g.103972 Transcript_64292/m.103972 type:complete len:236 (-) Transcript_64292:470-1177(-)
MAGAVAAALPRASSGFMAASVKKTRPSSAISSSVPSGSGAGVGAANGAANGVADVAADGAADDAEMEGIPGSVGSSRGRVHGGGNRWIKLPLRYFLVGKIRPFLFWKTLAPRWRLIASTSACQSGYPLFTGLLFSVTFCMNLSRATDCLSMNQPTPAISLKKSAKSLGRSCQGRLASPRSWFWSCLTSMRSWPKSCPASPRSWFWSSVASPRSWCCSGITSPRSWLLSWLSSPTF